MRFELPILAALLLLAGCASNQLLGGGAVSSPYRDLSTLSNGQIVHLPTGREFTEDEFVAYLGQQRVVYVGESHDNVEDHALQLKVLTRLYERFPGRIALGMEMLRTNAQEAADKWSRGELEEKEFVRTWVENWGNTFPYYADILRFVRDRKIPLLALNRPRPPKHTDKEGAEPPPPPPEPEIDYDDPYYKAFIDSFFAGHGDGKPDVAQKFLKSQLLWDETMAETAAAYLKKPENADRKLVVFAGGNHVRYGFGMPRRLFRRVPDPYAAIETVVLKYPEEKKEKLMDVSPPELPLRVADFAYALGYTDLEDKTVLLGVGIEAAKPEGVLVKSVFPKSSAEEAGVLADDVIVAVDGAPVKEMFDLTYAISTKKVGEKGVVTVLRGGEKKDLPLVYAPLKHPKDKAP